MLRGQLEQAKAEFEPLWAQYKSTSSQFFGYPLARLGHEAEARALVEDLIHDPKANPALVFLGYYGLKQYDKALVWVRRAIDERSDLARSVRMPNAFPGLQEQPAYADVLAHFDSIQRSP